MISWYIHTYTFWVNKAERAPFYYDFFLQLEKIEENT